MEEFGGFARRHNRRIISTCVKAAMIAAIISLSPSFGVQGRNLVMVASSTQSSVPAMCGWIGVRVKPVTKTFAESIGMDVPYGAIFASPLPGSPAARAGIEAGDVLTTINGNPLQKWTDFAGIIRSLAPGNTVQLWMRRNGQLMGVKLTLGGGKCSQAKQPRGQSHNRQ